jgi:hypothetical protein
MGEYSKAMSVGGHQIQCTSNISNIYPKNFRLRRAKNLLKYLGDAWGGETLAFSILGEGEGTKIHGAGGGGMSNFFLQ